MLYTPVEKSFAEGRATPAPRRAKLTAQTGALYNRPGKTEASATYLNKSPPKHTGPYCLASEKVWPMKALYPALLGWLFALSSFAPAEVVLHLPFDKQEDLANCTASAGNISLATEPENIHGGTGALQLAYDPTPYVTITVANLDIAGAKSMSVWVKANTRTPLQYTLAEEDGSAYEGLCNIPANQWVNITISLADLHLLPLTDDENNQLDVDQVRTVSFMDLSNMGGEWDRALGKKTGPQQIWLDELKFDTAEVAPRATIIDQGATKVSVLADFRDKVLHGLLVGDTALSFVPGASGQQNDFAAQLQYTIAGWQWSGVVLPVFRAVLTGLREVRLQVRAERDTRLHVLLEENKGTRYEQKVELTGDGQWRLVSARVENFNWDGTSPADENNQLDVDQVRFCIIVVDTFNSLPDEQGIGRLAIDNVAFVAQQ